jgi:hypothetical protein
MASQTWTLTIKNGSPDSLQAPNGLDSLCGGTPSGTPPQWALAPGAQTTFTCTVDAAQKNPLTGMMSWAGPNGTATLNWIVPSGAAAPTYSPSFTGTYSVTASNTSSTAVTYTVAGTSTGTTPSNGAAAPAAPPGAPVAVTPTTGATSVGKSKAPQLWILGDANGMAFPHFNCGGGFGDHVQDKLPGDQPGDDKDAVANPKHLDGRPVLDSKGVPVPNGPNAIYRTLASSGCGLFAVSTLLGGYDVIVPEWDTTAKAFASTATKGTVDMRTPKDEGQPYGATSQMASPRAFLHFLWHYIMMNNPTKCPTEVAAKEGNGTGILGSDPNGALQYAAPLEGALSFLFTYHPFAYDAQGNYLASPPGFGLTFAAPVSGGPWPQGTAIQAISDSIINDHQPVLIGVGPKKCWHQVLVVGVAKNEGKTYYIAIDSGFSGDNHPGPLLSATVPLAWPKVVQYTISDKGGWRRPKVPNIFWYRLFNGNAALENAYDFTLYCKGVTEW